jgi:hypothetical protein
MLIKGELLILRTIYLKPYKLHNRVYNITQKWFVFNNSGSISKFFDSEPAAVEYIEDILDDTPSAIVIKDLCIVEIKYFVDNNKLVKT